MGRICAWCGAVLSRTAISGSPVSHAICSGCRSELESALARTGLRVRGSATPPAR